MSKADVFFRRKARREGWSCSRQKVDKNDDTTYGRNNTSQEKTVCNSADVYFRKKALKEGWQDGDNTNNKN